MRCPPANSFCCPKVLRLSPRLWVPCCPISTGQPTEPFKSESGKRLPCSSPWEGGGWLPPCLASAASWPLCPSAACSLLGVVSWPPDRPKLDKFILSQASALVPSGLEGSAPPRSSNSSLWSSKTQLKCHLREALPDPFCKPGPCALPGFQDHISLIYFIDIICHNENGLGCLLSTSWLSFFLSSVHSGRAGCRFFLCAGPASSRRSASLSSVNDRDTVVSQPPGPSS